MARPPVREPARVRTRLGQTAFLEEHPSKPKAGLDQRRVQCDRAPQLRFGTLEFLRPSEDSESLVPVDVFVVACHPGVGTRKGYPAWEGASDRPLHVGRSQLFVQSTGREPDIRRLGEQRQRLFQDNARSPDVYFDHPTRRREIPRPNESFVVRQSPDRVEDSARHLQVKGDIRRQPRSAEDIEVQKGGTLEDHRVLSALGTGDQTQERRLGTSDVQRRPLGQRLDGFVRPPSLMALDEREICVQTARLGLRWCLGGVRRSGTVGSRRHGSNDDGQRGESPVDGHHGYLK